MLKSLGVFPQKLVLELGTGCGAHHVVHKQAMDNEVLTLALHENCLLTVDCGVAILFHPVLDVHMPSACCLSGSIYALEELKAMAFGFGFGPPVLSPDIYHVISHAAIQEGLARICLIDRETLRCGNCKY